MRIEFVRRDDERKRSALGAEIDLALCHAIEVAHEVVAVAGGGADEPACGGQVVVDDVAELPVAARPGVGKCRRRLVIGKAAAAAELIGGDRDRRGDANARRFVSSVTVLRPSGAESS